MGNLGQMPHLVEEPVILLSLIKILNFTGVYVRPRSVYKTRESMNILLTFITNSPETKVNHSQTSCEIVIQHLLVY